MVLGSADLYSCKGMYFPENSKAQALKSKYLFFWSFVSHLEKGMLDGKYLLHLTES